MTTKILLEKIAEMFASNTALLRKEMREMEERLDKHFEERLRNTKGQLEKLILKSQKETTNVLTDFIEAGYDDHEKRIKKIEKHLHIVQTQ